MTFLADGTTLIHKALYYGRNDLVELFLSIQPKLALISNNSYPLTHLALILGGFESYKEQCIACFNALINKGADIEAVDRMGRSVLHWAAFYNMKELVSQLIDKGLDCMKEDYGGMNTVDICVVRDNVETLKILVDKVKGEKLLERAMKSGAWKYLFFLLGKVGGCSKLLKKSAEESGWATEYQVLEPFIHQVLAGNIIDTNAVIEKAITGDNKKVESILLIATDASCPQHIPLVKGPADKRLKQMKEQVESEERVKLLVEPPPSGLLLIDEYLETDLWLSSCQEATIVDILRVHEYSYVKQIIDHCKKAEELKCNFQFNFR